MELYEWLTIATWIAPIPFMIIYHIKTTRFSLLTYPTIFFPTIFMSLGTVFAGKFLPFIFHSDVLISYSIMVGVGMYFLRVRKNLNYLQALSLAFVVSFVVSFYWEVPIFLYTIFYRGYIDQAMPLHILSALPAFFVEQKIRKVNLGKSKLISVLASGLVVSALFILPLIYAGVFPSSLDAGSAPYPSWALTMWTANRIICFFPLLYIVYRSELR